MLQAAISAAHMMRSLGAAHATSSYAVEDIHLPKFGLCWNQQPKPDGSTPVM